MPRTTTAGRLFRLSISSVLGTFAGGVLATAWIGVLNQRAEDGPNFPPALVALYVVIPVTLALLPFQAIVELLQARARPLPWWRIEVLAVGGGLSAAYLLFRFLIDASEKKEPWTIAVVLGFSLLQAFVTLSSLRVMAPARRQP